MSLVLALTVLFKICKMFLTSFFYIYYFLMFVVHNIFQFLLHVNKYPIYDNLLLLSYHDINFLLLINIYMIKIIVTDVLCKSYNTKLKSLYLPQNVTRYAHFCPNHGAKVRICITLKYFFFINYCVLLALSLIHILSQLI